MIVVPDGVLSTLPFEALGPRAAERRAGVRGARYTFVYMPSATVLTFERTAKRSRGATGSRPLLAVGDPVYEDLERQAGAGRAGAARPGHPLGARGDQEARAVVFDAAAGHPRRGQSHRHHAGRAARTRPTSAWAAPPTRRTSRPSTSSAYRFLHFATHGVLAGDVPYLNQPALVLSQTADLGGEDGFLTMSEVLRLPLRSDMVVLSACQTALGREVTGEGVVGLSRAFLYAGSRAAVVSLWPVDDASTAVFMAKFYAHVKGGLPPARALARAKQELRADPAHAHPFYWAPVRLLRRRLRRLPVRRWTAGARHRPGAVDGARVGPARHAAVAPFARRALGRGGAHDPGLSRRRGALHSQHEASVREALAALEEGRRLHKAGALPAAYVEQAERDLAAAERELDEAQKALDEADRLLFEAALQQRLAVLPALPRGGFEDRAMLVRFNGAAPWSLKSVPALEQRFVAAFGRALPISAFGQTKVHDRLGLDHRTAIDVAVPPDSAEGQWLMKDLRAAGIPFIGVRGVVAGASTGAHVHIGPESPRLLVR